jgi:hypothetical protein
LTRLILPDASGLVVYGSLPILIAELSTGLWLLIKGISTPPANEDPVVNRRAFQEKTT